MDNDLFLYNKTKKLLKFKIVGFIPSRDFQKCLYLIEKLHSCYPDIYDKPEIRAMLNLEWDEYLTKMKRRFGKPYYLLQSTVAVYLDGQLLGNHKALEEYIAKRYSIEITVNFDEIIEKELIKYFTEISENYKRKFAYITIAIDGHVYGSMLFMLYNDLVPLTCKNFLQRCTDPDNGYKNTKIHRIAKYSWVQCGRGAMNPTEMPCENYAVPHNRRGVLSMCNKRRHEDNSTEFFINLNPAPWMDYYYVAFGQLIQGAEILNLIEKVSVNNESPSRTIKIINCGEFSLCPSPVLSYTQAMSPSYDTLFAKDMQDDDIDSILSESGYKSGKYFLKTDLRPYLPFSRYSKMFENYIENLDVCDENDDDKFVQTNNDVNVTPRFGLLDRSTQFYAKMSI